MLKPKAIADVTPVQVHNLTSRQWQPGVVKDYSSLAGFGVGALWEARAFMLSVGSMSWWRVGKKRAASSSTV
ncbi:hypothetical protein A4S05_11290 [Nostoc sp. KVJ20]|uniref:hypothetical protein n=1 Tax=Nostoc sp. KVJ20 TaxID=457944 RepID=UPI00083DFD10|nr:hypothetical protein [Nostoc sp. KVJ20]ODG97970.1 hypothetical protein A4S05_11290 [Nostoc sp. KVJ20]